MKHALIILALLALLGGAGGCAVKKDLRPFPPAPEFTCTQPVSMDGEIVGIFMCDPDVRAYVKWENDVFQWAMEAQGK